jgi:hypothetical protein
MTYDGSLVSGSLTSAIVATSGTGVAPSGAGVAPSGAGVAPSGGLSIRTVPLCKSYYFKINVQVNV